MEEDEEILRGAMSQSEPDLSCSIKWAALDISSTESLLSPLHYVFVFFTLKWGIVRKILRCNIMGHKDSGLQSYLCYILVSKHQEHLFLSAKMEENCHSRKFHTSASCLFFYSSKIRTQTPVQGPVKVGHFGKGNFNHNTNVLTPIVFL